MAKIFTDAFHGKLADNFIEDVVNGDYYIFGGRASPTGNDITPPDIDDSIYVQYNKTDSEIIFAQKLGSSNISRMIKCPLWVSGTVYDMYDDKLNDISSANMLVRTFVNGEHSVFKCISNVNSSDTPSTFKPIKTHTSPSDDLYQLADGYIWKYMYSINDTTYNRFAVSDFVPVIIDNDVMNSAVPGSLDTIVIESPGAGYISTATGNIIDPISGGNLLKFGIAGDTNSSLSIDNDFYKDCYIYITSGIGQGELKRITSYMIEGSNRYVIVDSQFSSTPQLLSTFKIGPFVNIIGDGEGAKAIADVDLVDYSIKSIDMISKGEGYTFANVEVSANSGVFTSYGDVYFSNPVELRAIISPSKGHGGDVYTELFADKVGVSVDFVSNEHPTDDNSYRKIGLLSSPIFDGVVLELSSLAGLAINDTLTQLSDGATGKIVSFDYDANTVTLESVTGGSFVEGGAINNQDDVSSTVVSASMTNRINNLTEITTSDTGNSTFTKNEFISQASTGARGFIHHIDGNILYVCEVESEFVVASDELGMIVGESSNTVGNIINITKPLYRKNSAKILNIETIQPIERDVATTERIKFVYEF